jgi:hypothetical protein
MKTTIEILKSNPKGKMTKVSGNNSIAFDNGVIFTCQTSKERANLWNKLKRIGYEQHYNFSSDEACGVVAAGNINESPFDFKIIKGK